MNELDQIRDRHQFKRVEVHQVPAKPGVYAIWCYNLSRCVYVGRSKNLKRRLKEHLEFESHNDELKLWLKGYQGNIEFCYLARPHDAIPKYERYFWKMLKPHTNKTEPDLPRPKEES